VDTEPANINTAFKSWHDLKDTAPASSTDVRYFEFSMDNGSKAFLVVADLKSKRIRLKPYANSPNCPTSSTAAQANAIVAVNGGYFNLSNGESTSYVVIDSKTVCDPHGNPALMTNVKLAPYMSQIIDRSELRILDGKSGKHSVQIARHSEPAPAGAVILDSLQAGPRLLPERGDRTEAFVRQDKDGKQFDSIGSYRKAARTAFGVTADGHAMIICVAGNKQDEFSSGATLTELASVLKRLGCINAINFDGGTSTTMVVKLKNDGDGSRAKQRQVCGKEPETRVKSVMVIEPCD
jgi:exopolysaccharide biosynthesis protein